MLLEEINDIRLSKLCARLIASIVPESDKIGEKRAICTARFIFHGEYQLGPEINNGKRQIN